MLHPELIDCVGAFYDDLIVKLDRAQTKYDYDPLGWKNPECVPGLRFELWKHTQKGDPLDVAAYAMFLWYHRASTVVPQVTLESLGVNLSQEDVWGMIQDSDKE